MFLAVYPHFSKCMSTVPMFQKMSGQADLCSLTKPSLIHRQYDLYNKARKHKIIWPSHVTYHTCGKSSFEHECAAIQSVGPYLWLWSVYLLAKVLKRLVY